MLSGQDGGDQKLDAIQALFEVFGGDTNRAISEAQKFAELDRLSRQSRPPRPQGAVLLTTEGLTKTYRLGRQKLEVL